MICTRYNILILSKFLINANDLSVVSIFPQETVRTNFSYYVTRLWKFNFPK